MTEDGRPDPEALLRRIVEKDESRPRKGRLKVFFGATAGVGKTYAMLEAARTAKAQGRDVVVGWVETHARQETAALLEGLDRLPARQVDHRGIQLGEFDLDAALVRRPGLLLLDELAHTNAPGSRHAKRWQDVEEILDAGLDVSTTLDVQHLESLNDLVAKITEVPIRETVPDRVLEEAAEVELVDLPPDELLQRLREGKVVVPEQASRAVERFFRKGNLIALRELALRRTAAHVDLRMRDYRRDHEIRETWPVTERVLVCLRPHPGTGRLVRATRRMAASLGAEWIAAYVESPSQPPLSSEERGHLDAAMRLAEQLGGETVVLSGATVAEALVEYARRHNVSKIVAGKPSHGRWRDRLRGSLLDEIVRASGDVDVYVISGERDEVTPARRWGLPARQSGAPQYAVAVATVLACTLLCRAMFGHFDNSNLVMVYLAGVAWVATRFGRGPAVLASVLSVATFNFFFVPPRFTFAVADPQYLVTFAVMLAVALTISTLAARVRRQADAAGAREARTRALYATSRELAGLTAPEEIAAAAARRANDLFEGDAVVLVAGNDGQLAPVDDAGRALLADAREGAVAAWAQQHGRPAGRGTGTSPGSSAVHVPLGEGAPALGVVALRTSRGLTVEEMDLLETIARLLAAPLERARLTRVAEAARLVAERERLRGTLLSSVSHDLRTPLAAITGAASTLLEAGPLPEAQREELQRTILEESQRLDRRVSNLLEMTRLESGQVDLRRDWHSLEEIVGGALSRLDHVLTSHRVETALAPELPLLHVDAVLIEQLLVNLLENAAKYTPAGSTVRVVAHRSDGDVELAVEDDGPGLPPGSEDRVFEKFYRERTGRSGFGLGLAICRAIVTAHGGRIEARNRHPHGVTFLALLPVPTTPPAQVPGEVDA